SRSAFITGMFVVLTPLTSTVIFRRLPRPPSLAGVVLAFAGTYWLTGAGTDAAPDRDALLGDLLTFGCALAYAVHLSLTEKYAKGSAAAPLVALQLWVVCGLSALAIPFGERNLEVTPGLVVALVFTGVLA